MFRKLKPQIGGFRDHPFAELPLLIVSGMGRSGTTVLRNCVAAHTKIQCRNYESNYLHDLMRAATENEEKPSRIPALPVTAEEYWDLHRQFILHLLWPVDRTDFHGAPQMVATYSMLDPRASIGLDKAFSELTIFYIVRNGIEVVSSYQAFEAFRHLSFEQVCKIWALRRDMHQYGNGRLNFHLFRFEWLLDRDVFAAKLQLAFEKIGLTWEPSCLAGLEKQFHPTKFPGESDANASDMTRRCERWRLWTDVQRSIFVEHCGQLMDELAYSIPWLGE